jgi:uncharacterized radical SAM protein YgiQ
MVLKQPRFLPVTPEEGKNLGIDQFDIILVSGDAYVDHPSFSTALLGRVLWDAGYTVGVVDQPDWRGREDFCRFGAPRLFFAVCPGNCDSMVNHYTAARKPRSDDLYSPGGIRKRPDRAALVYTDKIHALFPDVPLVLGGIEASLRRFAHYDYWADRVRQAILADSPADLLVFGMGELQLLEIARGLSRGIPVEEFGRIPGTSVRMSVSEYSELEDPGYVEIPSFSEVSTDKVAYAKAFSLHYREQDPIRGHPVVQPHPKTVILQNPPARPLTTQELDGLYELPYSRKAHPGYNKPVPALETVRCSLTSHRGCFGGCSFCALTHHQGRIIQNRSIGSLVREAERLAAMPGFKGVISDVGGPTANMYGMNCPQWASRGTCPDRNCNPDCPGLHVSHSAQMELLRRLREVPGVRWVFIGSGLRYDLLLADPMDYLPELCQFHVSGHLKIAPEHIVPHVTSRMGKPGLPVLEDFLKRFEGLQKGKKKRQYVLPYLMSGHPGCTIRDMIILAEYLRDQKLYTEQVQDFTPTPMTASTCMYYTGLDPFTMEPVHVPKGREKTIQRALLQYRDPGKRSLIEEGLVLSDRRDLIGYGSRCLIPPREGGDGSSKEKERRTWKQKKTD